MGPPITRARMDEVFGIPEALRGERLDRALALLTGLSRSEVNDLIDAGQVHLGSRPVTARSRRLQPGEEVVVVGGATRAARDAPAAQGDVVFEVVWSDADVVVVDKPAGLVVHPGSGNTEGTLVNGLLARFADMADSFSGSGEPERPGVVHRLDKGTSGLLVFARHPAALALLREHTESRRVPDDAHPRPPRQRLIGENGCAVEELADGADLDDTGLGQQGPGTGVVERMVGGGHRRRHRPTA